MLNFSQATLRIGTRDGRGLDFVGLELEEGDFETSFGVGGAANELQVARGETGDLTALERVASS